MSSLTDGEEAVGDLLAVSEELRPFMTEGVISGEGILYGSER